MPICISSEEPYPRWFGNEILGHEKDEINREYIDAGLFGFCDSHDTRRLIGIVEDVTIDADKKMRGMVRFGAHPDASWLKSDILSGVRKGISVGYRVDHMTLVEADEENWDYTYRVDRWTPMEASTVAVPADPTVGAGRDASREAFDVEVNIPEHLKPRMRAGDGTMSDKEKGGAPSPQSGPTADEVRATEQQRTNDIVALATENGVLDRVGELLTLSKADAGLKILEWKRTATPPKPVVTDVHNREGDKPWPSFSEFMRCVKRAADGKIDARLHGTMEQRGIATGMGIGNDSDGGFAVPEQFAQGIVTRAFEGGKILKYVNRIPVTGNQYHLTLVDETSRATGSRWGGIRGYRIGENDTPTASKPKLRRATLDVTKKLAVVAYVSEEQLQDAPATDTILEQAMSEELTFCLEREIWEGIGGGEAIGVMNSGALVTCSKKAAQTAATFVAENATAMNARLHSRSHTSAAWFIQQQVLNQLPLMVIGTQPVWLPPTGLVGSSPFGTLLGKPVEVVEYASALGTLGDVGLFDFQQYALGEKSLSQLLRSIHVRFLQGEEAFRLTHRNDGTPMWNAPLTPFKGADTTSPFVVVETRA